STRDWSSDVCSSDLVALLVLVVAQAGVDAQDGLRHLEDLARGQELEEHPGRGGEDRRAAARAHLKAQSRLAVRPPDPGPEGEVEIGSASCRARVGGA